MNNLRSVKKIKIMIRLFICYILLVGFINKVSAQDGFLFINVANGMEEKKYNYCIRYNGDTLIKDSYEHSYLQNSGIYLHFKNLNKRSKNIIIIFEGREMLTIEPKVIKKLKVLNLYWENKWVSTLRIESPKVKIKELKKSYTTIIDLKTGKVTKKKW